MDFMKILDQTVREIKREVNLKVLKVPEIEQKVLDATSDEPWGPHGSALSEIAQATKKFTECQMIMNVLWTRLTETGSNWRHVYKGLSVIEYLVSNGSERALDEILGRSHRIAALSDFQYVDPNGKDAGINVRKKVETILALLSDKEKIHQAREKAMANRDKYFGLSSTGITYKSSSARPGGSSSDHSDLYSSEKTNGFFKDSYRERQQYGGESGKGKGKGEYTMNSREIFSKENAESKSNMGFRGHARNLDSQPSTSSKPLAKPHSAPSPPASTESKANTDDFDDFDPRETSKDASASGSLNQVDLFSQNLIDNLMDAMPPSTTEATTLNFSPEVDLFADVAFVSASPHAETSRDSHKKICMQGKFDLFASQPDNSAIDSFEASSTGLTSDSKAYVSVPSNNGNFDPFAAIPLNNFEQSDQFGDFSSHMTSASNESPQDSSNNVGQNSGQASKPASKKDTFQVKSGIWADSLSRGLIDLNITAPKKTSLADMGIVAGLSDGSDEKENGLCTSMFMGRAMGPGTGFGRTGFSSSTSMATNGLGSKQQYGSFK